MSTELIEALKNTSVYPHIATDIEVVETHLSWVLLTGPFAYKIKKPLALGFQDFTTLELRKKYCELEVEFNKALAPDIYIETVAIYGNATSPSFTPNGPVLEYAVKMHEFSQDKLLSVFAEQNKLSIRHVENIAKSLALFHQQSEKCPSQLPYGSPDAVFKDVMDNFRALKELNIDPALKILVQDIEQATQNDCAQLRDTIEARKKAGFVRACHGDLHLGNIVMLKNEPVIFDCIEFNEGFRYTDVMSDVAFLAMDLDHADKSALASLFINRYFELSTDYEGAKVLRFYQCYRAMVRAKVSALFIEQLAEGDSKKPHLQQELTAFLQLAKHYTQPGKPELMIMMGPSGSGKTLYSEELITQQQAIRLRSDVIRKQLFGLDPMTKSTAAQKQALYSPEATMRLYQHLQKVAKTLISYGYSVIIDATCLQEWQRALFIEVAKQTQIDFEIFLFICPIEVLEQRLISRATQQDASDADASILGMQIDEAEPLTEEEEEFTTFISTETIDNLIDNKEQYHA
ncbi:MAG: AAA family ATPase [Candidatus Berkiella sp.]